VLLPPVLHLLHLPVQHLLQHPELSDGDEGMAASKTYAVLVSRLLAAGEHITLNDCNFVTKVCTSS
jgi:hypothetical protein